MSGTLIIELGRCGWGRGNRDLFIYEIRLGVVMVGFSSSHLTARLRGLRMQLKLLEAKLQGGAK